MKPMKNACSKIIPSRTPWLSGSCCGRGRFRPLLAEPTENTIIQLFRYVITGASSFFGGFSPPVSAGAGRGCIIFRRPPPPSWWGISCNFLLTKLLLPLSLWTPLWAPPRKSLSLPPSPAAVCVLTMVLMYLFTSQLQLYFMVSKLISSILVFFLEFPGSEVHSLPPGKVHEHA